MSSFSLVSPEEALQEIGSLHSPNSSLVGIAIVTCDGVELNGSESGNLFLGKGSFSFSPLIILNN